jgi:hypothetical protein
MSGTLLSMMNDVFRTLFLVDVVGTFTSVTVLLLERELHFKLHSWALFKTFD